MESFLGRRTQLAVTLALRAGLVHGRQKYKGSIAQGGWKDGKPLSWQGLSLPIWAGKFTYQYAQQRPFARGRLRTCCVWRLSKQGGDETRECLCVQCDQASLFVLGCLSHYRVWVPRERMCVYTCVCVRVCVCVSECVRVCVFARAMRLCVRERVGCWHLDIAMAGDLRAKIRVHRERVRAHMHAFDERNE